MSGHRNSGLAQEDYEDREILKAAAGVINRRWPDGNIYVVLAASKLHELANEIGDANGE